MARHIELNPVSHLTVGTIGPPGQRVFYLQGSQDAEAISLIIEKHHAAALATGIESLLEELARQYPESGGRQGDVWLDMRLQEPVTALFRVGNIGLGYNEAIDRVVVVAYELVPEEEEPNVASFWATRKQVRALAKHAQDVVKAGRPVCGNCGQPMDPSGHFCPHRNGHKM